MKELKRQWQQFKHNAPGKRFENLYNRCHQPDVPTPVRFLLPTFGLLLIVLGLVLIPAPGPGNLVIVLGIGLIATAIKPLAHWMDRAELKVRALASKFKDFWKRASLSIKTLIGVLALTLILGMGYGCYRFFWGNSA